MRLIHKNEAEVAGKNLIQGDFESLVVSCALADAFLEYVMANDPRDLIFPLMSLPKPSVRVLDRLRVLAESEGMEDHAQMLNCVLAEHKRREGINE